MEDEGEEMRRWGEGESERERRRGLEASGRWAGKGKAWTPGRAKSDTEEAWLEGVSAVSRVTSAYECGLAFIPCLEVDF